MKHRLKLVKRTLARWEKWTRHIKRCYSLGTILYVARFDRHVGRNPHLLSRHLQNSLHEMLGVLTTMGVSRITLSKLSRNRENRLAKYFDAWLSYSKRYLNTKTKEAATNQSVILRLTRKALKYADFHKVIVVLSSWITACNVKRMSRRAIKKMTDMYTLEHIQIWWRFMAVSQNLKHKFRNLRVDHYQNVIQKYWGYWRLLCKQTYR